MASAWGDAWGSSWGASWGAGDAPPIPNLPVLRHGGLSPRRMRQADREAEDFELARSRDREALRKSVERAFRRADGLPDDDGETATAVPEGEREAFLIADVRQSLSLAGVMASLAEIERMIAELQAIREQQIEDEAAALLLLMA